MTTVAQAEKIILSELRDYGTENIYFEDALGRVLAENLYADRDLPPYNRVTMDGIAIKFDAFKNGIRSFKIIATQAAGDTTFEINHPSECIEIMTGAALPATTDTVIRYEDLDIKDGIATVQTENVIQGQSLHLKGKDKLKGDIVAKAGTAVTAALVQMAASVGKKDLLVQKLPRLVIISSGDELIEVDKTPNAYQVRRSNNYSMRAALKHYAVDAQMLHIPDDAAITKQQIEKCLTQYDVIILSGGVSEGKFDYIPKALESCGVQKLFHKVQQRPGRPFWFGKHNSGVLVFAFPGNPVSTFMCLHRYCIPWLEASTGRVTKKMFAILDSDFTFMPALQYFLQVKLYMNEQAQLMATPIEGHGSGDFANLIDTDAFMELPLERNNFTKGEVFQVWTFAGNVKW